MKSAYLTAKRIHRLTANEYFSLINNRQRKANIKSSRFVSPDIGSAGYGYFEVTYKTPVINEGWTV